MTGVIRESSIPGLIFVMSLTEEKPWVEMEEDILEDKAGMQKEPGVWTITVPSTDEPVRKG